MSLSKIVIQDHLGAWWEFLLPGTFKENRNGLTEMWVYVGRRPNSLKNYQEIPLPVFTDWWN